MGELSRSRSYSHSDGRNMQIEVYGGGGGGDGGRPATHAYDLRSYSTSYAAASSSVYNSSNYGHQQPKLKKGKSVSGGFGLLNDPELQRKKRVAGYKVYSVEGKVKGSFRKSFRWLKDRYTHVVYGWW